MISNVLLRLIALLALSCAIVEGDSNSYGSRQNKGYGDSYDSKSKKSQGYGSKSGYKKSLQYINVDFDSTYKKGSISDSKKNSYGGGSSDSKHNLKYGGDSSNSKKNSYGGGSSNIGDINHQSKKSYGSYGSSDSKKNNGYGSKSKHVSSLSCSNQSCIFPFLETDLDSERACECGPNSFVSAKPKALSHYKKQSSYGYGNHGGLCHRFFEDYWCNDVNFFKQNDPENCSVAEEIDFSFSEGEAPAFSSQYTGLFKAKKSGIYHFNLTSDDASAMVLGGAVIIENLYIHAAVTCSDSVYLKKGYYKVNIYYGNVVSLSSNSAVSTIAPLGSYPGYDGNVTITGMAVLTFNNSDGSVKIDFHLEGVETACLTPDANKPNSCGIHIHSGKGCADSSEPGGHYYNLPYTPLTDPWKTVVYTADGTTAKGSVNVNNNATFAETEGRVLVVHDITGARVTCAVITEDSGTNGPASFHFEWKAPNANTFTSDLRENFTPTEKCARCKSSNQRYGNH